MSRPRGRFELLAAAGRKSKIPCGRPRKKATRKAPEPYAAPRPQPIGGGTGITGARCIDPSSASLEFGSSHGWPNLLRKSSCTPEALQIASTASVLLQYRVFLSVPTDDNNGKSLEAVVMQAIRKDNCHEGETCIRSSRLASTMAHGVVKHVRQRRRSRRLQR